MSSKPSIKSGKSSKRRKPLPIPIDSLRAALSPKSRPHDPQISADHSSRPCAVAYARVRVPDLLLEGANDIGAFETLSASREFRSSHLQTLLASHLCPNANAQSNLHLRLFDLGNSTVGVVAPNSLPYALIVDEIALNRRLKRELKDLQNLKKSLLNATPKRRGRHSRSNSSASTHSSSSSKISKS